MKNFNQFNLNIKLPEAISLAEKFSVEETKIVKGQEVKKYNILREQRNAEGQIMGIDETLSKYLTQAASLIAEIDGSAEEDIFSKNKEIKQKPDNVIFLDKSARPLHGLVNHLWKDLAAPDAKKPQIDFVNIDRQDFFNDIGLANIDGRSIETGNILTPLDLRDALKDSEKAKKIFEYVSAMRAYFVEGELDQEKPISEQVWDMPTRFDGKNVMIIDETKRSGSTMEISKTLFNMAFPDMKSVRGEYFWPQDGKKMIGGEIEHGSVPVWYNAGTSFGRGIGDRSDTYFEQKFERLKDSKSFKQKIGSKVLSAPHHIMNESKFEGYQGDTPFVQLMEDFKDLRDDFRNGKVLFIPPLNYGFSRMDKVLLEQGFTQEKDGSFPSLNQVREIQANRR